MAPELLKSAQNYDTKVDMWSFGIFAYELAEGDPPHLYEYQERAIYLIINKQPPRISDKWSDEFKDFVSKCLVKNPAERWHSTQLLNHPFLKDAT